MVRKKTLMLVAALLCGVALLVGVGLSSPGSRDGSLATTSLSSASKPTGEGSQEAPSPDAADSPAQGASPIPSANGTAQAAPGVDGGTRIQGEGGSVPSGQKEVVPSAEPFELPDDASYEPDVVLVSLREGTTTEQVEALLEASDTVVARHVSEGELSGGLLELQLAPGASVEDAVNDLSDAQIVESAQPDYVYVAMMGSEADLRARLAAAQEAEAGLPSVEDMTSQTDDTAADGQSGRSSDGETLVEDSEAQSESAKPGELAESKEPEELEEPDESKTAADAEEAQDATAAAPSDESASLIEALSVNDPYALDGTQWALSSIRAFEAWAQARCEKAVTIAMIDMAIPLDHPDLAVNVVGTYNARQKTESLGPAKQHGTHVAGILAGEANNAQGIAGVSYNAGLLVISVFDDSGRTSTKHVVEAYRYLMEQAERLNIRVVNMSIGMATSNPDFEDDQMIASFKEARSQHGIVTVVSSGNSDQGTPPYYEYPGDSPHAVSVINLLHKGSDPSDVAKSPRSNYNVAGQTAKDISAPGTDIMSTIPSSTYGKMSGTSMASPHVAGTLALEFAANPSLSADQAVDILFSTARDLGDKGWDEAYGYGEVDASAAVAAAKAGEDEPIEPEYPEPTVAGATRVPVGATAAYTVKDGTMRIKEGTAAQLEGAILTGVSTGKVTLALYDEGDKERSSFDVEVYDTKGAWTIATALDQRFVLDVTGNSVVNGGNAELWAANGGRNQIWLLDRDDAGQVVVRSALSGKVLDVAGGSKADCANVLQWSSEGRAWQTWRMTVHADNTVSFLNSHSGKALDVEGGTAGYGRNVLQFASHGRSNQRWVLRPTTVDVGLVWDGEYRISSAANRSFVVDVAWASAANGANVQLWTSIGGPNQIWRFSYLGSGIYRITSKLSGKSFDIAWGSGEAGANVLQWDYSGAAWQQWQLGRNADGTYTIFRRGTNMVIDAYGGVAYDGCNIHQWPNIGSVAQRWYLTQY